MQSRGLKNKNMFLVWILMQGCSNGAWISEIMNNAFQPISEKWMKYLASSSQEHCSDHCLTQADTSTREKFDFTPRSFTQLLLCRTCSFHTLAFTHLQLINTNQALYVDSHACPVVVPPGAAAASAALDLSLAVAGSSVTIPQQSC